MRRLLAACLLPILLLASAGCVRTEPVYDVHDAALPAGAHGLPPDEIGRKLAEAVARARWHVVRAEPAQILATYDAGSHAATAAITWTERSYSITLVSSDNLKEQGGQIHRTYNAWVRNLEREINDAAYVGAAVAPAGAAAATAARAPDAAVPRFGDSVAFACPRPGSEIEFRGGATRVFAAAKGDGIRCPYRLDGRRRSATPFGTYSGDAERALKKLWPLKLGNKVSFEVASASGQGLRYESYRVSRHAPVTVKAGTFDAFVIDWSSHSTGQGNAYSETGAFWYAPEVGYIVKTQHQLTSGYARLADDEAVRITR